MIWTCIHIWRLFDYFPIFSCIVQPYLCTNLWAALENCHSMKLFVCLAALPTPCPQVRVHWPGVLGIYPTQQHTAGESFGQGAMLLSSLGSLHVLRHDFPLLGQTLSCHLCPAATRPGHVVCCLLLGPPHQNQQNCQDFQWRERRSGCSEATLH